MLSSLRQRNFLSLCLCGLPSLLRPVACGALAGIHRLNQCGSSTWFQPIYEGMDSADVGGRQDWRIWRDGSSVAWAPPSDDGASAKPHGPYEIAPGRSVFSRYHLPAEGGVSEKYAGREYAPGRAGADGLPVVQLEYKAAADALYFDLSLVDCHGKDADGRPGAGGCLFRDGGYLVHFDGVPSPHRRCPHLYCEATRDHSARCEDAYHHPSDLEGTHACRYGGDMHDTVNMTVVFCPTDEQLARHGHRRRWASP